MSELDEKWPVRFVPTSPKTAKRQYAHRVVCSAPHSLPPATTMDAEQEREDVPRVAVDSLHDWARIRMSYTDAAMAQLEARLAGTRRTPAEQERLRSMLEKVRARDL